MKNFIILLLIIISPILTAQTITIEDNDLTALPQAIDRAVRDHKNFRSTTCKLIGKSFDLANSKLAYFVTTDDACDWGRAAGPIWVVKNSESITILASGGYAITLNQEYQNGLRCWLIQWHRASTHNTEKIPNKSRY